MSRFTKIALVLRNPSALLTLKKSLVLSSIPKSGTNWLKLILGNYFINIDRHHSQYVAIEYDVFNSVFPNNVRGIFFENREESSREYPLTEFNSLYKDFLYDHVSLFDNHEVLSPKRRVYLYRNPLDVLISRYYYSYRNRVGREKIVSHPREIIGQIIPKYASQWLQIRKNSSRSQNYLIAYESLSKSAESTTAGLIRWLGIPLVGSCVSWSLDVSSIDSVRKTELKRGEAIHSPPQGLKGSFARDGSIGQWRDYFSNRDIREISDLLARYDIDLFKEFIVD